MANQTDVRGPPVNCRVAAPIHRRTPWRAAAMGGVLLVVASVIPLQSQVSSPSQTSPRVSRLRDHAGWENVVALIPFTVDDPQTPLARFSIQATSSNETLIPTRHILLYGTGRHRLLSLAPAVNQTGTSVIHLMADNGRGGIHRQTFSLRIQPDPNRDSAALMMSALVQTNPPQITLIWTDDPTAQTYSLYRREQPDAPWGQPLATVSGRASSYADRAVKVGIKYDYKLSKIGNYHNTAYLQAGINIPLVDQRGSVILIVEEACSRKLPFELKRLEQDLTGDGWSVLRHEVHRGDSVQEVKALIQADYAAHPSQTKSVFLFGHVPIPYSGLVTAPDGHTTDQVAGSHKGAWPADVFYADMDGIWTDEAFADSLPENPTLYRLPNRNFIGDGKFDQDHLPSDVELQIGRVDLFNMPEFLPKTEMDLLQQYLNKNHDYRQKRFEAARRAIVLDKFGVHSQDRQWRKGILPASRAFSTFFGSANVRAQDWFPAVHRESYLCGYAGGPAHDTGINRWADTSQFAAGTVLVVFHQLFGSYFGDWHTGNNFLRAPLAAEGYGLTSSWGNHPPWHYSHLALGETTGYCTRASQNSREDTTVNGATGLPFHRGIWIALMGDPTLRLHTVAPPRNLLLTKTNKQHLLTWTESEDAVEGYHVYRAAKPEGPFSRLTDSPAPQFRFLDTNPLPGQATYMVRAIKMETSASGTYFNPSQGVFASVFPPRREIPTPDRTANTNTPARSEPPPGPPAIFLADPPSFTASPGEPIFFTIHAAGGPTKVHTHGVVEYVRQPERTEEGYLDIHRTPIPSRQWTGTVTYDYSYRLPRAISPGTYSILYSLSTGRSRVPLRPGPNVQADPKRRYRIGTVTVVPDTNAPVITLRRLDGQELVGGQTAAGSTAWRIHVDDPGGVGRVEVYFDGKRLWEDAPANQGRLVNQIVRLDLGGYTNGLYGLKVVAADQAGNRTQNRCQIEVANPTVYPLSVPEVQVARGHPFELEFDFSGGPLDKDLRVCVYFKDVRSGKTYGPMKHVPVPPTSQWPGDRFRYTKRYAQFPIPGTFEVWVQFDGHGMPLRPGNPAVAADATNQRFKVGTLSVTKASK